MRSFLLALIVLAASVEPATSRPRPSGPADAADKAAAWEQHQALEQSSLLNGLEWRSVGPVYMGGRLVDIETVPDEVDTFYVAYASGGLWKTTNAGATFEPLSDQWPTMIIGDIALDPNNPDRLWIGTGENNSSRSSYGGMGMYVSDDGGKTVRYAGLGDSDRIGRVLIDPRDSDRVIVGALGKLYTTGGQRGVYLTEDGGVTWTQTLPGGDWTGVIDLAFEPGNPEVVYAATWERSRRPWDFVEGGTGSAVWKSTDGGRSFSRLGGGLPQGEHVGRIGLATAASAPQTLYACIDNQEPLPEELWDLGDRPLSPKRLRRMSKEEFLAQDPQEIEAFIQRNDLDTSLDAEKLIEMVEADEVTIEDLLAEISDANANLFNTDIRGLELYRSDDGGASWRRTHEEPIRSVVYTYGYYFGQCRVSPTDPDRVYLLGVPLITTADGGATFTGLNQPSVHVDHQAMWIDPNHPQRLFLGNDGGLDISHDGGAHWRTVDAQPVGQFYTIAVDMAEPYNVYGGLQDNGSVKGSSRNRWQNGPSFERLYGGDGMYVNVDPRDNKTTYVGYQFGWYARIGNGPRQEVRPRDALGEPALRYNWNTPVRLSNHNADIVYFGANQLFRSFDQGQTWTALSDDLTRSQARGDVPFATITSLAESPLKFELVWVGTDDGQVWVTDTGGTRWDNVADRLPRDRWVSRVEASQHVRDRAYVSLNGYRDDDITAYVYVTENLGKRWRDISDGLPDEPVNVIKEDPENPDVLYVGTDRGVYASLDRGASWQALQGGLPNVPVHDLVVHPRERELVAGTHGRSIWIVDVLPVQELASVRDEPLALFTIDEVKAQGNWRSERSEWFHREENEPRSVVHVWSDAAGAGAIEIVDGDEHVLRQIDVNLQRGVNRVEWDLMVDPAAAIAAEAAAADDESSTLSFAESQKLGHPPYVMPGTYTVRAVRGEESATTSVTIKAPEPLKPRQKKPDSIRGKSAAM